VIAKLVPSSTGVQAVAFGESTGAVCYGFVDGTSGQQLVQCTGIEKSSPTSVSIKHGLNPENIGIVNGARFIASGLSSTVAIVCHDTSPRCRALTYVQGEVVKSDTNLTVAVHSTVNEIASGRFSDTQTAVCYSDNTQNKGKCTVVTYVAGADAASSTLARGPSSADAVFQTLSAPRAVAVASFTTSKAALCWTESVASRLECKVMTLQPSGPQADGELLTPATASSGAVLRVSSGASSSTSAQLALGKVASGLVVLCFNDAVGGRLLCNTMKLDTVTDTLTLGTIPLVIQNTAASDITLSSSGSATVTVCAETRSKVTCSTMGLIGSVLVKRVDTVLPDAKMVPQKPALAAFPQTSGDFRTRQGLLCFKDGIQQLVLCVVTYAAVGTCSYMLPGYTCGQALCKGGTWQDAPVCSASCGVADITIPWQQDAAQADIRCPALGGPRLTVSASTSYGKVTTVTFDESKAMVCYLNEATDLQAGLTGNGVCYGLTKHAAGISMGKAGARLTGATNGTVTRAAGELAAIKVGTNRALVCYDALTASTTFPTALRKLPIFCLTMLYAGGEVTVSGNVTLFSQEGSFIGMSRLSETQAIVCFASIVGFCNTLTVAETGGSELVVGGTAAQFSSSATISIVVQAFSDQHAVVCWMESVAVLPKGQCQVVTNNNGLLTVSGLTAMAVSSSSMSELSASLFSHDHCTTMLQRWGQHWHVQHHNSGCVWSDGLCRYTSGCADRRVNVYLHGCYKQHHGHGVLPGLPRCVLCNVDLERPQSCACCKCRCV